MTQGPAQAQAAALTPEERRLLTLAQSHFPLVVEPFAALAVEVGWTEEAVRTRFQEWLESGLVRRLGAIFDSNRLGYRSALLAAKVTPGEVAAVTAEVNAWPGVSHNYLRDDAGTGYNLWFTLTVEPGQSLTDEIAVLTARLNLGTLLVLPTTRLFKIRVEFPLVEEGKGEASEPQAKAEQWPAGEPGAAEPAPLTAEEWRVVKSFTADLPVIPRPFAALGREAGVTEDRALGVLAALRRTGVIRRFGATLKHFAVGFPANAMSVWQVAPEDEERVGGILAGSSLVTHCYARSTRPEWPFSLFAMLHAPNRQALAAEAARLAAAAGVTPEQYRLLFTERELKKERLWYGGERA